MLEMPEMLRMFEMIKMLKMIAYASRQAHSSAERAGLLGGVKIRLLDTDDDYR